MMFDGWCRFRINLEKGPPACLHCLANDSISSILTFPYASPAPTASPYLRKTPSRQLGREMRILV